MQLNWTCRTKLHEPTVSMFEQLFDSRGKIVINYTKQIRIYVERTKTYKLVWTQFVKLQTHQISSYIKQINVSKREGGFDKNRRRRFRVGNKREYGDVAIWIIVILEISRRLSFAIWFKNVWKEHDTNASRTLSN